MMFSAFCPTHDTRVLLTRRNVLSFWNGPDGPVIQWKCGCGHEGFLDANGSSTDCSGEQNGCDVPAVPSPAPVAQTAS